MHIRLNRARASALPMLDQHQNLGIATCTIVGFKMMPIYHQERFKAERGHKRKPPEEITGRECGRGGILTTKRRCIAGETTRDDVCKQEKQQEKIANKKNSQFKMVHGENPENKPVPTTPVGR